jgi:predicted house-cleaning NTP pyrophosphatase (Maf/HAM1 superfamily)
VVTLGDVSDAEIDQYVGSGAWKGKAGGYNLSDRIEAGWPIRYSGESSTIMGMPMPLLERLMKDDRP